jgi:hypothetical protein
MVMVNGKGSSGFRITKAIPYDLVTDIEPKKQDLFEISGRVTDHLGKETGESHSFEIRSPKGEVDDFRTSMKQCSEIIEDVRNSGTPTHDLSYLEKMPVTLTRDAILDLNTVLRDQPIHEELVHEASKFLGDEPFLLEESLRDENDRENGVLLAAGTQGYYWIQGKKQGRFMSNVIVDTVEWEYFRGFSYQWHREIPTIKAVYSLSRDGKLLTKEHRWCPTLNEDTSRYPWLLQEFNGPWIMSDIRRRCITK